MDNTIQWFRLALIPLLLFIAAGCAFADSQWDIAVNVPYRMGINTSNGDFSAMADGVYPLPTVEWHYYFGSEVFHFGPGLKLWTVVFESVLYPVVTVESYLGNFVINGSIGGGAFLLFGVFSIVDATSIFIPEITVAYRLGKEKRFSLGAGALFFIAPGIIDTDEFGFVGTVLARFTF